MTQQTAEFGLCGCRINPNRCLRTSSEIHAAGEREVRISKGFRRRLSILTERDMESRTEPHCVFRVYVDQEKTLEYQRQAKLPSLPLVQIAERIPKSNVSARDKHY